MLWRAGHGTTLPRQFVTMLWDHKIVVYCIMLICIVATPFRLRGLDIFRIFSSQWNSTVLRCCVVVVAKLKSVTVTCPALMLSIVFFMSVVHSTYTYKIPVLIYHGIYATYEGNIYISSGEHKSVFPFIASFFPLQLSSFFHVVIEAFYATRTNKF